jgi:hypothetical protein
MFNALFPDGISIENRVGNIHALNKLKWEKL